MAWMMCLLAADEVAAALTVQKEWNGDCIGSELKIAECPQQLSWDERQVSDKPHKGMQSADCECHPLWFLAAATVRGLDVGPCISWCDQGRDT